MNPVKRAGQAGLLGLILALLITPGTLLAYGARQSTNPLTLVQPQTLRIIFGVDKAQGTVTEILDSNYLAAPDNGVWLIPLPSAPISVNALDATTSSGLDVLMYNTLPTFSYSVDYCAYMVPATIANNSGDGATFPPTSEMDYSVITNNAPDAVIDQLGSDGYPVSPQTKPIIAQYVQAGDIFLLLRFKVTEDTADQPQIVPPIQITYRGSDKIVYPIRLDAATTDHDLNVLVWIYADTQFVPINYQHVPLSITAQDIVIQHSEIADMEGVDIAFANSEPNLILSAARQRINQQTDNQAFITEYARVNSTQFSVPTDGTSPELYPYVTRLSGVIPPGASVDPAFAPSAGTSDIPNMIDLTTLVDPLQLAGCSTQAIADSRVTAKFEHSHTIFPDLRFTVGYPASWILSKLTTYRNPMSHDTSTQIPQPVYVYAPQPVTNKTLDAYFKGERVPPMFVFAPLTFPGQDQGVWQYCYFCSSSQRALLYAIGYNLFLSDVQIPYAEQRHATDLSLQPVHPGDTTFPIVAFGILANDQDWQASSSLFHDMLAYATAHLYNLGSNQRDSLFLSALVLDDYGNGVVTNDVFEIPIPEGWNAHTDTNGDVLITPQNGAKSDSIPTMSLSPLEDKNGIVQSGILLTGSDPQSPNSSAYPADRIKRILDFYGLPDNPQDNAIKAALTTCTDTAKLSPIAFHHNGLTGFVLLNSDYIVGIYAPDADFARYQNTLQAMMNAYIADYRCAAILGKTP